MLLISILLFSKHAQTKSDFNCQSVCGIYSKEDKVGPYLNNECKAFEKCDNTGGNITKGATNRKVEEKTEGTRIVGGVKATASMPWMVKLPYF